MVSSTTLVYWHCGWILIFSHDSASQLFDIPPWHTNTVKLCSNANNVCLILLQCPRRADGPWQWFSVEEFSQSPHRFHSGSVLLLLRSPVLLHKHEGDIFFVCNAVEPHLLALLKQTPADTECWTCCSEHLSSGNHLAEASSTTLQLRNLQKPHQRAAYKFLFGMTFHVFWLTSECIGVTSCEFQLSGAAPLWAKTF